jgi:Ser/Thr protein kinase RdoA (MazF antagonist)
MTSYTPPFARALGEACAAIGLGAHDAVPIRLAENGIWRLPGGVILRINQPGQELAARRELRAARWLAASGIATVLPLDIEQPVNADGRPATFWHELPEYEHGTIADVASVLRSLHALPAPDIDLGRLDPFVRINARLRSALTLSDDDRKWLLDLHDKLAASWASMADSLPVCVVHGDAWPGNIVRTNTGPLLMDLERISLGPHQWDLVSTAVRARTTGAVTADEYDEFCLLYGEDVTARPEYAILAGARELRMTSYAAQHAVHNPAWRDEAQHRVDCLRGKSGPRPWKWTGIM